MADESGGKSLLADLVLQTSDLEHQLARSKMGLYENIHRSILQPMENVTRLVERKMVEIVMLSLLLSLSFLVHGILYVQFLFISS